jgi:nucleotide-binding universal stress UspA family protein
MISTILVPLDGSAMAEAAVPYAQELLPAGGKLVLLRVLPEFDLLLTEFLGTLEEEFAEEGEAERETAQEVLSLAAKRFAGTGLHPVTEVRRGDPASQILQAVARHQVDLVSMTTHGRGAAGRATYGSVADRVARESPVPVLMIRPDACAHEPPLIRRLLVPLDGSTLAEAALPLAGETAKRLGVPVHLVQAVDTAAALASLSGEGLFAISPSGEVYQQMVDALQQGAQQTLQGAAAQLQGEGVAASREVLSGSPYLAIAEATKPGDVIVMTSHGRSGVLRWLLGSVAEKLVREAPVPVLLVPTPGRGARKVAG